MPTYLSRHDALQKVDLGDDFWVEVKTHLTHGETKTARRAMIKARLTITDEKSETSADIDMVEYQDAKVFAAIVNWNLTDASDNILPLQPDEAKAASIALLDDADFTKILAVVEGVSKDKSKKAGTSARQFPG